MISLIKKKLKYLYSNITKIIFDAIYCKIIVGNMKFFYDNTKIKKIYLTKKRAKKYNLYIIKQGRIYSDNSENVAVIKENCLMPKLSIQLGNNCLLSHKKNGILRTGSRILIQRKIRGKMLSLVQGASAINNYGHWLLDILPKLFISEKLRKFSYYDAIYLPSYKKKFQIDTLKYFNIDKSKIIDGSVIRHVYADEITMPEHPYWKVNKFQLDTVSKVDPEMIKLLRNKFLLKKQKKNKYDRLFIDRSDSLFNHNQIINYKEVYQFLLKKKFIKLNLSRLSFDEQISYFYNAKIILGAHGAGLCNTIFCKSGTTLIELSNSIDKCYLFKNISKINKMKYYNIISKGDSQSNKIYPRIFIPISKIAKIV